MSTKQGLNPDALTAVSQSNDFSTKSPLGLGSILRASVESTDVDKTVEDKLNKDL